jgi:uncharacterized protein with LGFP repeats
VICWSPATGAHEVHAAIYTSYKAAGGAAGMLGFPTTDVKATPDGVGRYSHFTGSGGASIYWSPKTGAQELHGDIRAKWASLGWEKGLLGYPTTDQAATADGAGQYSDFSGSGGASIFWSPTTGAHEIHGAIRTKWASLGSEKGVLGYPTTDENITPDRIGRYTHFSGSGGASIFWSPKTGAREVHGAIRAKWASLGWEKGLLGYPTTDQTATVDGSGQYSHFSGSGGASIYWSPTTGAHEVHGTIRTKWASLGWEKGALGSPTTDQKITPDRVGQYTHFSGAGGASIYWSPKTGAHEVHGAIRAKWASLGWEKGKLGYPLTDEMGTLDKVGRYNHFSGSGGASIYWSPKTGGHEVHGAIRAKWASLGWEKGRLGYPVSDEYAVPGGRQSDFRSGRLVWTARTGVVSG